MTREGLTDADLGPMIQAQSRSTVGRYRRRERLPSPGTMARIYLVSAGAVTPNDFYDLPALPAAQAAE